jgi:pimeloyl-ACP methyl ester carboxylesterase
MMSTMGKRSSVKALIAVLAWSWCCLLVIGQEKPQSPAGGQLVRPQEPKPPFPYSSEDVSYPNPNAAGVELAGTLTKPNTNSPVPAVLLISGAGPQDRDETMAGHKLFLVLSDYLTRRGVAVLRVDDRGTGASKGTFKDATTKDFASDAEAGFQYLMTRPDLDHKHIGLIGHGEGAIEAAIVAASNTQVAFVVLLNGTAAPGQEVLLAQTARAESAAGVPEEQMDADLRLGAGLYKMVQQGRTGEEMERALANVPEGYRPFVESWRRQIPRLQSPWLAFFLSYNPATALEKIQCPVLALFGEKDMTIDPDQNASAMKKAFSHGHNRDAKVKVMPGLNYLFQKANTGLATEYASISETISPTALEAIGEWISKEVQ